MSQFAQRRAEYHKKIHSQSSPSTSTDTTKIEETLPIKFILGNIVERKGGEIDGKREQSRLADDDIQSDGFPKPTRIDKNVITYFRYTSHVTYTFEKKLKLENIFVRQVKLTPSTNKSLFAMTQQTKAAQPSEDPQPNRSSGDKLNFGSDSIMLDNAEAQAIHKENAEFLKRCGEDEILKEQQRLLGTLDSSLVKFLQEKRKKKLASIAEGELFHEFCAQE